MVQEISLGKKVTIVCGLKRVNLQAFFCLCNSFQQTNIQPFFEIQEELMHRVSSCASSLYLSVGIHEPRRVIFVDGLESLVLLNTVVTYRVCQATDPRDKIYTLLEVRLLKGYKGDRILRLVPSYDTSVQDLYKQFARYFISKGKVHSILEQCGAEHLIQDLPSWSPDWSVCERIARISAFDKSIEPERKFRASGDLLQAFKFSHNMDILLIEGILITQIKSITSFATPNSTTGTTAAQILLESLLLVLNQDISEPTPIDFIQNRIEALEEAYMDGLGQAYVAGGTKMDARERTLTAIPNDQFTIKTNSQMTPIDPISTPSNTNDWILIRTGLLLSGRRFCVSSDGYFGIVPKETQVHDWICVFLGVPVPFVIRKCEDGYILVGDCYVHGLMEGEAVRKVEESSLHVQTISLV